MMELQGLSEWIQLLEKAFRYVNSNTVPTARISEVQILYKFAFSLDLYAYPIFERVHHAMVIPQPFSEEPNQGKMNLGYGLVRHFYSVRTNKMQSYAIRSKGADFNLLPLRTLKDLFLNNRKGCYSVGRDMNHPGTILVLAHLFLEEIPNIESITTCFESIENRKIDYSFSVTLVHSKKCVNISASIKVNDFTGENEPIS